MLTSTESRMTTEALIESLEPEAYEGFRSLIGEQYQEASHDELREMLAEVVSDMSPEEMEGFFKSLKKIGKKAFKFAKKAVPGVIKGATTGFSVGGPWGALIGGVGGGAISGLSGSRRRPRPRPRGRPGRGRGRASSRLLRLLQSPQLLRSIGSLVAGRRGRRSVPAGGSRVPIGGILNLLGSLANRAAVEAHELEAAEAVPEYLLDESGEALGDIANPDERADMLWEFLDETGELDDDEDAEGEDAGEAWGESADWAEGSLVATDGLTTEAEVIAWQD